MKPDEYFAKLLEELSGHLSWISEVESSLVTVRQHGIEEDVDKLQQQIAASQVLASSHFYWQYLTFNLMYFLVVFALVF